MIVLQTLKETTSIPPKKLLPIFKTAAPFEELHCLPNRCLKIVIVMSKF